MKKVFLQYWLESGRHWGVRPDGCSLHLTIEDNKKFIDSIYSGRDINDIPDEYERIIGEPIEIWITDEIYNEIVNNSGTLRLPQCSMSNLRKMKEMQPILQNEFLN